MAIEERNQRQRKYSWGPLRKALQSASTEKPVYVSGGPTWTVRELYRRLGCICGKESASKTRSAGDAGGPTRKKRESVSCEDRKGEDEGGEEALDTDRVGCRGDTIGGAPKGGRSKGKKYEGEE